VLIKVRRNHLTTTWHLGCPYPMNRHSAYHLRQASFVHSLQFQATQNHPSAHRRLQTSPTMMKVQLALFLTFAGVILAGPARTHCGQTKTFTATNACGIAYKEYVCTFPSTSSCSFSRMHEISTFTMSKADSQTELGSNAPLVIALCRISRSQCARLPLLIMLP
jgi:hypothetical protein